ncbi:hypothetical protein FQN60_017501, partial [Etheostoma spectabile]
IYCYTAELHLRSGERLTLKQHVDIVDVQGDGPPLHQIISGVKLVEMKPEAMFDRAAICGAPDRDCHRRTQSHTGAASKKTHWETKYRNQ